MPLTWKTSTLLHILYTVLTWCICSIWKRSFRADSSVISKGVQNCGVQSCNQFSSNFRYVYRNGILIPGKDWIKLIKFLSKYVWAHLSSPHSFAYRTFFLFFIQCSGSGSVAFLKLEDPQYYSLWRTVIRFSLFIIRQWLYVNFSLSWEPIHCLTESKRDSVADPERLFTPDPDPAQPFRYFGMRIRP